MAVLCFELISGKEILSKIASETDDAYQLENPVMIFLEAGKGYAMMPHMPYCDGDVILYKNTIAFKGDPLVELENQYSKSFGSGIEIASSSMLITG